MSDWYGWEPPKSGLVGSPHYVAGHEPAHVRIKQLEGQLEIALDELSALSHQSGGQGSLSNSTARPA